MEAYEEEDIITEKKGSKNWKGKEEEGWKVIWRKKNGLKADLRADEEEKKNKMDTDNAQHLWSNIKSIFWLQKSLRKCIENEYIKDKKEIFNKSISIMHTTNYRKLFASMESSPGLHSAALFYFELLLNLTLRCSCNHYV